MKEVTNTTVYQFGNELIVELIGTDEYGDVATETVEFTLIEPDAGEVRPREEIPTEYTEYVCTALSENSYSLADVCG
ncbi:hypothetical protein [Haloarcula sp. JP-L23]|uniref:hypothetical protein n=1 Tax=Haloarcula sp. JP-L23 TaxID=2716717 RepID=UPI00140F14F6|nr:hypothetical protein G9465_24345 [Haloarcula sp. JP-L23]